jgi:hypothetical protein
MSDEENILLEGVVSKTRAVTLCSFDKLEQRKITLFTTQDAPDVHPCAFDV